MMSSLLSVSQVFQYIGYIFIAILVLLLMVLIHELGHFIAGKILKFKINEFSVGFGPKLLQKKKKNGELITLRAFPLGGYCAFEGENEDGTESPEAFNNQKPWKRLIVLFSGAFFNFLSAIIFSFILLFFCGYDLAQVKKINTNSINYNILQTNDVVYGIEDHKIDFVDDDFVSTLITDYLEKDYRYYFGDVTKEENRFTKNEKIYYMVKTPITFNIMRNSKEIDVEGYVNTIYNSGGEYVGWSLLSTNVENKAEFSLCNYKYSFGESLTQAVPFTCKWAWKVLVVFGQLLTGKVPIKALSGPVGTINMIASYTQQSLSFLAMMLPLIAVNLAVFNLLPIPALDGFQMIFVIIEWIRKKPVKREIINIVNNIGLFLLLGLVVIIDIMQFIL